VKNLLLYSLLALLLAPGAVATDSPATSDDQGIATSSACSDSRYSLDDLNAEDLAAWLDRIGGESFDPDPAERMSVPACPDIQPCGDGCVPGEGPCFIKPLGSSECCSGDQCFRCEGGTEIFVITCPCFGKGCPRQSLELTCA
jgi:hypothetical protein